MGSSVLKVFANDNTCTTASKTFTDTGAGCPADGVGGSAIIQCFTDGSWAAIVWLSNTGCGQPGGAEPTNIWAGYNDGCLSLGPSKSIKVVCPTQGTKLTLSATNWQTTSSTCDSTKAKSTATVPLDVCRSVSDTLYSKTTCTAAGLVKFAVYGTYQCSGAPTDTLTGLSSGCVTNGASVLLSSSFTVQSGCSVPSTGSMVLPSYALLAAVFVIVAAVL